MPSSIPYDPSLSLGNIVDLKALKNLLELDKYQSKIDAAQEELNSHIAMKRSLMMTLNELGTLNVDTSAINHQMWDVDQNIEKSAITYANVYVENSEIIKDKKSKITLVNSSQESPIDYTRSRIKKMPLAADSLKMDSQYFSFNRNSQTAADFSSQVGGFVTASVSGVFKSASASVSGAAQEQISSQLESHTIDGTLVISATCTHKDALVFAPLVIDVDKAISVWNTMFPSDRLKNTKEAAANMAKIAMQEGNDDEGIPILSGATYGSSFVGMVHLARTKSTSSSQSMKSVTASVQKQAQVNLFFAKYNGSFGLNRSASSDLKSLLSSQSITSYVSLVTMGCIPSIKSNILSYSIKAFNMDPNEMMNKLSTLQNATQDNNSTMGSQAAAARLGKEMTEVQGSTITSVISSVANTDEVQNKLLDINSLMTAFEDYVDKALAGNVGVPINYYIKFITKAQLAQLWLNKYYPESLEIKFGADDTGKSSEDNAGN